MECAAGVIFASSKLGPFLFGMRKKTRSEFKFGWVDAVLDSAHHVEVYGCTLFLGVEAIVRAVSSCKQSLQQYLLNN